MLEGRLRRLRISGEPMYQNRIIGFIDILGFKKMITQKSSFEIEKILEWPKNYFDIKKYENNKSLIKQKKNISQFSDSLIISFQCESEHEVYNTVVDILLIIIGWINQGIICRGAIVKGDIVHTKEYIYGPGFVKAYEMEKKAKYPRIILESDVIEIGKIYHQAQNSIEIEETYLNSMFNQDIDNEYYIDYFSAPIAYNRNSKIDHMQYLSKIKDIIISGLLSNDINIMEKYNWMKHKYNESLNAMIKYRDKNFYVLYPDLNKASLQKLVIK